MKNRKPLGAISGALAILLACPQWAPAAITWNVTFDDVVNNTGVGFDDATLGATRQSTFLSVTNYLNTVLDANGSVDFLVNNSETDGGGSLASSGPYFFGGPDGYQNGLLFQHATTGIDPTGAVPDALATFDFGYNWNSDLSSPTGGEVDLFTVALHEVSHSLGFLSLLNSDGTSGISGGDPGVFSVYDSFLELGDGTSLFNAGAGDYTGTAADLISNDVYFGGANAMAANGGSPVAVYSPGTFNDGSSIGHITAAGAVMNFSVASGVEKREYLAIELGILQDIGWSLVAVPEPSSALLLLAGFMGISLHRRRA